MVYEAWMVVTFLYHDRTCYLCAIIALVSTKKGREVFLGATVKLQGELVQAVVDERCGETGLRAVATLDKQIEGAE